MKLKEALAVSVALNVAIVLLVILDWLANRQPKWMIPLHDNPSAGK